MKALPNASQDFKELNPGIFMRVGKKSDIQPVLERKRDIHENRKYRYVNGSGEHVHLLDNKPLIGTSRVGSILAKPLAWYGAGKAVEVFGCPDPKVLTRIKNKKATAAEKEAHRKGLEGALAIIKQCDIDQYAALVDQAYRAHDVYMRSRAKTGTDLHAECEAFVKDEMGISRGESNRRGGYDPQIEPLIAWAANNVKRFLWSEGHCFSERHWLGGISDAGYETKDGKFGVLDFKSSKEAYMDQFWQCCGYAIQIEENGIFDADGNIIGMVNRPIDEVCVFPFGGDKPRPYFYYDMAGGKEAFLAELLIYNKLPKD